MKTICEWDKCNNLGEFKAPVEKDNSRKYRMLCLIHIKKFNKNWNYFSGMNDQQIMEFIKSDMLWHKPTQSFSSSDNFFKVLWNNALKDETDIFAMDVPRQVGSHWVFGCKQRMVVFWIQSRNVLKT